MEDDDRLTSPLNQHQRPRYQVGDLLRVTGGVMDGWFVTVLSIQTFQAIGVSRV